MTDKTLSITLIQDWNGHKRGGVLPIVPHDQALKMIELGTARLTDAKVDNTGGDSKRSSKRSKPASRSKKASGNTPSSSKA